ncbi:MAG: PaaI family thioesterase [Acidobacteriaceae bacterium]
MSEADDRLHPLANGALHHCFGCGQQNRTGLRLRFFTNAAGEVVCRVKLAERFQGPPGHAHGGIIATLLDEAMSKANRAREVVAMTRSLEVEYLRPVPVGIRLELKSRHVRAEGRKHFCEAELSNDAGEVLARGRALFIAIDPGKFDARRPTPQKV